MVLVVGETVAPFIDWPRLLGFTGKRDKKRVGESMRLRRSRRRIQRRRKKYKRRNINGRRRRW